MAPLLTVKRLAPYMDRKTQEIHAELKTAGSPWTVCRIGAKNIDRREISISISFLINTFERYSAVWITSVIQTDGEEGVFVRTDTLGDNSDISERFLSHDFWTNWIEEIVAELRQQRGAYILSNRIRKELVAAVWHPRRVAHLLEVGGWDAIDTF